MCIHAYLQHEPSQNFVLHGVCNALILESLHSSVGKRPAISPLVWLRHGSSEAIVLRYDQPAPYQAAQTMPAMPRHWSLLLLRSGAHFWQPGMASSTSGVKALYSQNCASHGDTALTHRVSHTVTQPCIGLVLNVHEAVLSQFVAHHSPPVASFARWPCSRHSCAQPPSAAGQL